MTKLALLLFALATTTHAAELKISMPDYKSAEQAKNYFKFVGHSRKLGIIGTSFDGYAKNARLTFDKKAERLENIKLVIAVADLDTDNDSRNEKMKESCLSAKEFPEIVVKIKGVIETEKDTQLVDGEMTVRGVTIPLPLQVEKGEGGSFKGSGSFRLSDAKIPDPSILVASVKDEFELEFQVNPNEASQ